MKALIITICAAVLMEAAAHSLIAQSDYRLLQFNGHYVKWGDPELGSGASLTYAIIDSSVLISGVRNCRKTSGLDRVIHDHMTRELFENEVAAAFAMWEEVADLEFVRVDDLNRADILIGEQIYPQGIAYADISSDSVSSGNIRRARKGMVCLNPNVAWILDEAADQSSHGLKLKYALAHEIGHLLGLDHPNPRGALMSFQVDSSSEKLRPGDVAGVAFLYGKSHKQTRSAEPPGQPTAN